MWKGEFHPLAPGTSLMCRSLMCRAGGRGRGAAGQGANVVSLTSQPGTTSGFSSIHSAGLWAASQTALPPNPGNAGEQVLGRAETCPPYSCWGGGAL